MNYWLVKTEPSTYSWEDLVKEKSTAWTGVRNYGARNNLRAMKKGDKVLVYYSGEDKAVIGIAEVTKESFPDPTTSESAWLAVQLKPVRLLPHPITLAQIKSTPTLKNMKLVKQGRLSVSPVNATEFKTITALV